MALTSPLFGLEDVKIAPWTSTSTWGSAIDLLGAQVFNISVETVNGRLEGDDIIVAAHSKIIAVEARVRFAFNDLDVLNTFAGITSVGNTSYKRITLGNENMPYFGIAGRILDIAEGGDMHLFVPKAKLMEGFEIGGSFGEFTTPEITVLGVWDSAIYEALTAIKHNVLTTVAIPITNT